MQLDEVLWPNNSLLIAFGLWPISPDTRLTQRQRFFICLRIIVTICSTLSMAVPLLATVLVDWDNIETLRDFGALAIIYTVLLFKILYYIWRRQKFASMYQYIKDFWKISEGSEERASYEKLAKIGKIVTIITLVAAMTDIIMYDTVSVITMMKNYDEANDSRQYTRQLPLQLNYGFDTQGTPTYQIIFIWQDTCAVIASAALVIGDCTMMVLVIHVAAQFRLINSRFRDIGRKIDEQTNLKDIEKQLHEEIGEGVAQHQHLIEVTRELNELLSPLMFVQIMTSGLVICLSGYAVIERGSNFIELLKCLILWFTMFLQLCIWCFPTELLITESGAIAMTIYHDIPWYRLTPKLRRDLNFIMARSQKECYISAFYQVMSIRRLTEVFNAAGAYMTFLRKMKNK